MLRNLVVFTLLMPMFATVTAMASTLATSTEMIFTLGSDGKVYKRTMNTDWSEYEAQLPTGVKGKAIVVVKTKGPWDGFGGQDIEVLYVIGSDGKSYQNIIGQSNFKLSRAALPNGVRPLAAD